MEKKVLLKDLVDTGTNLRKQIISKVRVSDEGAYPIGELWDANTVIDVIVNGAHEQHDTLRELDGLAHTNETNIRNEVNRAKTAEQQLEDKKADRTEMNNLIGDLGTTVIGAKPEYWVMNGVEYNTDPTFQESTNFDYIHDEASWNESFQNGGLKLYYEANPSEDLWNTVENRPANINDRAADGTYPNCIHSWQGAINAPGAQYPWIVPYFTTDVNAKIIFRYEGKEDIQHWGEKIFGNGNNHKAWGCASIPVELGNEFLLANGETTFDISKFKMILHNQSEIIYHPADPGIVVDHTVKSYVDEAIQNLLIQYISANIPNDSIGTQQIKDGSIKLEDLSDEVTNQMRATVDEDDENVNIPG